MKIGIYITEWRQQWLEEFIAGAVRLCHSCITPEIVFGSDHPIESWK
jgi:predicted TIM-barrel fold metal-dependent hydrolase